MTIHYLVDTDWAIHYFNGHPDITKRLEALKHEGLGLSVISLAELYEGVYYSRDPQGDEEALEDFLKGVVVIGVDGRTCQLFGKERGRLRAQGKTVGDFDLLIGATALQHDLTLLTNNRRHFEMIEGIKASVGGVRSSSPP
jgi:tRNA(fMet)-specific endonuclease VapC